MEPTNPANTPGTNGTGPAPVKYGPGPGQELPHAWAEGVLRILATERARVFSELVGRVSLNGGGPGADVHN